MSNTELRKQIQEDFFILDGATGSNLQKAGMKSGGMSGTVDLKPSGHFY